MKMRKTLNMISVLLLIFIDSAVGSSFSDAQMVPVSLDQFPEVMETELSDLLIPAMQEKKQGRYEVLVTALNNPSKESEVKAQQKVEFLKKLVREQKELETERYEVLASASRNPELQGPAMMHLLAAFKKMDASFVRKRHAVEDFLQALKKRQPFDSILSRNRMLQAKIMDRLRSIYLKEGPDPEDLEEKYHISTVLRSFLLSLVKNVQIQHELNLW